MADQRTRVLADVARLVVDRRRAVSRPALVAVDGVDGAGKTHFADELAGPLTGAGEVVVRAGIDEFHHPRASRHAEGRTAEAVWGRHFDYAAVRRELLDPWCTGPGAAYRTRWHDVATDSYVASSPRRVPDAGLLLVDGVFLQRPELDGVWDLVIFLDVPFVVSVARMAARDGTVADVEHPDQRRYADAQRRYLTECDPRGRADVLLDNGDLRRPRRLRPAPGGREE